MGAIYLDLVHWRHTEGLLVYMYISLRMPFAHHGNNCLLNLTRGTWTYSLRELVEVIKHDWHFVMCQWGACGWRSMGKSLKESVGDMPQWATEDCDLCFFQVCFF